MHQEAFEKKMFGGLTFMVSGHMCSGVLNENLLPPSLLRTSRKLYKIHIPNYRFHRKNYERNKEEIYEQNDEYADSIHASFSDDLRACFGAGAEWVYPSAFASGASAARNETACARSICPAFEQAASR